MTIANTKVVDSTSKYIVKSKGIGSEIDQIMVDAEELASGNNEFMRFYTDVAATQRGSISFNRAGTLTAYNTTSDQRLKENIVDAPSQWDKVKNSKLRVFDWKDIYGTLIGGVISLFILLLILPSL